MNILKSMSFTLEVDCMICELYLNKAVKEKINFILGFTPITL